MKISMSRSGGFAGLTSKFTFDSTGKSEELVGEAKTLVKAALPVKSSTLGDIGADMMQYTLDVTEDVLTSHVAFSDADMNDNLEALVKFVVDNG